MTINTLNPVKANILDVIDTGAWYDTVHNSDFQELVDWKYLIPDYMRQKVLGKAGSAPPYRLTTIAYRALVAHHRLSVPSPPVAPDALAEVERRLEQKLAVARYYAPNDSSYVMGINEAIEVVRDMRKGTTA